MKMQIPSIFLFFLGSSRKLHWKSENDLFVRLTRSGMLLEKTLRFKIGTRIPVEKFITDGGGGREKKIMVKRIHNRLNWSKQWRDSRDG